MCFDLCIFFLTYVIPNTNGDDSPKRRAIPILLYWEILVCFNTLRTGDADLRFYITTVQDG